MIGGGLMARLSLALLGATPEASEDLRGASGKEVPAYSQTVEALFEPWDRDDAPGYALAVLRDGQTELSAAYGMADLERGVPLDTQSVFDIGSTAKQFTALLVLVLAEEGFFALDDPAVRYLPELPNLGEATTLRHLLHHTSGVRDYLGLMLLAGLPDTNQHPVERILDLVARQQGRLFEPGERFSYCNTGYILLARIVERVTGERFADVMETRLFAPLGMRETQVVDDNARLIPRRALAYAPLDEGGFRHDGSALELVGDGAVLTTLGDLARWDAIFRQNPLPGGQGLIDRALERGVLNDGTRLDYAAGLIHGTLAGTEQPLISHAGGWAGYRSQFLRLPEHRLSVICLSNRRDGDPFLLAHQVARLALGMELLPAADGPEGSAPSTTATTQSATTPTAPSLSTTTSTVTQAAASGPPAEIAELLGVWDCPEVGHQHRWEWVDSRLEVDLGAGLRLAVEPRGDDRFEARAVSWAAEPVKSLPLTVERDAAGRAASLVFGGDLVAGVRCHVERA